MQSIGYRLRQLREAKGYSQTEVAARLNCSNKVLSNYELDRRTPDYNILIQLCDLYGASADYVLGRTDSPAGSAVQLTGAQQQLLALVREMPQETQRDVLRYAKFAAAENEGR